MVNQTIRFLSSDNPVLDAGVYTVTVKQTFATPDHVRETHSSSLSFEVGETSNRIERGDVLGRFPAQGSVADDSDVLPHIVLRDRSLPWQRSPSGEVDTKDPNPWMALLVVEPSELAAPSRVRVLGTEHVDTQPLHWEDLKSILPTKREPQLAGGFLPRR